MIIEQALKIFNSLTLKIKAAVTAFFLLLIYFLFFNSVPSITALSPNARILAFGDSLTHGRGARSPNTQSYPAVLERLIGHRVINEGISGEISARGLERLPALLDKHEPELMLLCHGGNDMLRKLSRTEQERNLDKMIMAAKKRGIDVILIGVPRPGIFLSSDDIYQRLAKKHELPLEDDVIADVLGSAATKSDIAHPNSKGYSRIARAIADIIKTSQK